MKNNSKLQNYYNYIINDLVSETSYDFDDEIIHLNLPWMTYHLFEEDIKDSLEGFKGKKNFFTTEGLSKGIIDFIGGKYGMYTDEITIILKQYLTIIYTKVLNDFDN
jgi:hypothetical protein